MPLLFQWRRRLEQPRGLRDRAARLSRPRARPRSASKTAPAARCATPSTTSDRLFITDAILHGMPPHIAQLVAGHRDINTTMGYKAVYPDEAINGHRAFIARRRALRPSRGIPHPHRRGMGRIPRPLRTPQGRHRRLRPLLRHPLHPRTQLSPLPIAASRPRRPAPPRTDPRQPHRPHRRSRIPPLATARPRASRSASPAPTPNSPRWTRSPPAAPTPSNSASPASPTPPAAPPPTRPPRPTPETSHDQPETPPTSRFQDHFSSSEKMYATPPIWPICSGWADCPRPGSPHRRPANCGSWCAIEPSWSQSDLVSPCRAGQGRRADRSLGPVRR